MKTDLRVRYTRKVIQEAFWTLLKEKPLAKITVKEVCERALINRSTFYKHYLDCYDLLDKMQEDVISQLEEQLASIKTQGMQKMVVSFMRSLQQEQEVLRILSRQGQSGAFLHRVVGCCYRYMEKHMDRMPGMSVEDPYQGMNDAFLVGGCVSGIEYWLHTEMIESPEAVAEHILWLGDALLKGLTQKASVQVTDAFWLNWNRYGFRQPPDRQCHPEV